MDPKPTICVGQVAGTQQNVDACGYPNQIKAGRRLVERNVLVDDDDLVPAVLDDARDRQQPEVRRHARL